MKIRLDRTADAKLFMRELQSGEIRQALERHFGANKASKIMEGLSDTLAMVRV